MIRTQQIPRSEAWTPDRDTVNSFTNGIYQPCKILGAARLVRLLSHAGQAPEGQMYKANLEEGSFWFDEQDYFRIKAAAEADLRSQAGKEDASAKLKSRIGIYLRHQFRLEGGLKQFVIDFRFQANSKAASWIDSNLRPIQ
jgi:hypothetical protein